MRKIGGILVFVLALSLAGTLGAREKTGAVYLVPQGAPQDLTNDMTEVLRSNIADRSDIVIIPKEKFLTRVTEISGRDARACLDDPVCIRNVGTGLNLALIAVGKLILVDDTYALVVTRYSLVGGKDKTYSKDGLHDIPAVIEAIKSIAQELKKAEGAYLVVTAKKPGATVFVDNKFIGALPLPPIPLTEGLHKLLVKRKGFKDYRAKVSARRGKTYEVAIQLEPASAEATATGGITKEEHRAATAVDHAAQSAAGGTHTWRIVGFTGLGLGAASLGAGLGFLVAAGKEASWLDDNCADGVCAYSEATMRDRTDKGQTDMTLANALIGTGAGLLVASTAVLIFLWDSGGDAAATTKGQASAAPSLPLVTPTFGPGYGGLSAHFSF